MTELLRTNNLVLMSFIEALMRDAAMEFVVLDAHVSVVGDVPFSRAFTLMVAAEDAARARRLLREAGIDPDSPL